MTLVERLTLFNGYAGRAAGWLSALLLLATRLWVSWQFMKSGLLKVQDWDTTLQLFQDEYHVPLLPPHVAAVAGATGELLFPVLLILGLGTRYAALGLAAVNVMAVVSYSQVLLAEGSEAALAQHVLWGYMLLVILVFGPGIVSVDAAAGSRRSGSRT
jgi:putative oxidoreductase